METAQFDYSLPEELIAQTPPLHRHDSRLLVVDRQDSCRLRHASFLDFPEYLRPGDVLVLNNSRVIPARLRAFRPGGSGSIEVMLLHPVARNDWWALMKPGKRIRPGTVLGLLDARREATKIQARVAEKNEAGHFRVEITGCEDISQELEHLGEIPLPPYIQRPADTGLDAERYQTVYAARNGSVAAPTAGLHFTPQLLECIRGNGVEICPLTLHVGYGTFAPVKASRIEEHRMHAERFFVPEEEAARINAAKQAGRRIIAVGTTSTRILESLADRGNGFIHPGAGETAIFIYPPRSFRMVDALLTNFHLPRSTLLMLVSAFMAPGKTGGLQWLLNAYREAVARRYRFFSYGDAMFIQ